VEQTKYIVINYGMKHFGKEHFFLEKII